MACRAADNYSGKDTAHVPRPNWSGDIVFDPRLWRVPVHQRDPQSRPGTGGNAQPGPPFITDDSTALASLVEAVAKATDDDVTLHAIGNGWAFEDCAKDDAVMVNLAHLNWQLHDVLDIRNNALLQSWLDKQTSPTNATHLVHYEAGIRILDLCQDLDTQHLAMPTLGGSNGQSLGGALSTSTHGGDWQQPPFPDLVRAVHLVTAGGEECWIEPASRPITSSENDSAALRAVLSCASLKIVRDDRVFDAVRVACGRFGVIYSVVLEVRRQFRVVQVVTTPTATNVLAALRAGQGTPSVMTPLFRLLNADPVPDGFEDATGVPYFLQVVFNSQRPTDVWVTRRWVTTPELPEHSLPVTGSSAELAQAIITLVNGALLEVLGISGATVLGVSSAILTLLLGPIGSLLAAGMTANFIVQVVNLIIRLDSMVIQGNPAFGTVLAAALNAAWQIPGLGFLIPQIQGMVTEKQLRSGQPPGCARGKHFEVSTGTREDNDQRDFRSASIEVVFDATTPSYLNFLDVVLAAAPGFRQAGYVSLRPSLRSSALLSMHNVSGPRAMSIEIASVRNLDGNDAWMAFVHQTALTFGGRPHWGQYNRLTAPDVEMLYGAALQNWREALLTISDRSTLCSNAFTRQRGLEPMDLVRSVTSVKKTRKGSITHICNDSETWSPVPVGTAISHIQGGVVTYLAVSDGSLAFISVVSDGKGGFYLRTRPDGTSADNLNSLPLSSR